MCPVQCTVIKFSGQQSVMGGVKCPTPVFVIAIRVLSPLCAHCSHCNSGHNALIITLKAAHYTSHHTLHYPVQIPILIILSFKVC